jgi:hypothetical protein
LMSWLSPSSQSKDLLQAVQTSWIRCLPYFFSVNFHILCGGNSGINFSI